MLKTVAQTFRIREGKLNYDQFLEPGAISQARRFLREYEELLSRAERAYGVDRCVIAAILLVETRFGSYTGRTPTLAVLSTFALMDQKAYRDKIWVLLSAADRERWDRDAFDRKLIQRSEWAHRELSALVQLADSPGANFKSVQGSVMGAIGWPQFLPSSLVRYGVDGNNDGRLDLFEPADAIFSVANYLRGHGWCEAGDQSAREDVIYQYNHSRPYVAAILGAASRLRTDHSSGDKPPMLLN
jgi:membrane-bound lytic murein transglycosylase B